MSEGEVFDRLVAGAGDFNPFTDGGWRVLARRFEGVEQGADLDVLDVGCGTGQSRRVYAGRSGHYVGIDLSLGALALAALRGRPVPVVSEPAATPAPRPRSSFVRADALVLPFPDQSFDVVALSSVLHHLPDRRSALAEARRVARPGGLVFAFDPNLWHPAMLLFRHPASPLYSPLGVSPDERPLAPPVLRADFAAAGLGSIGQRAQSGIAYRAVAPRLLNALLPLYNSGDRVFEWVGLGRWFGSFAVTWGRRADVLARADDRPDGAAARGSEALAR